MKWAPSNCKVAHQQSREAGLGFLLLPIVSESPHRDRDEDRDKGRGQGQTSARVRPGRVSSSPPQSHDAGVGSRYGAWRQKALWRMLGVLQRAAMLPLLLRFSAPGPALAEMLMRVFNSKLQRYVSYYP